MALGEGSAAMDAGIDLTCIAAPVNGLDQRGVMRPQGTHCDSGSVEQMQEPAAPTLVDVCDEAHLRAALAGGGTVMFTCSGEILLTAEIVIAANTTIDGSGQDVTISGNHAARVFHVTPGNTFIVNGLKVADGSSPSGGGIYSDAGAVFVRHSLFSGHSGGAIVNEGGTLTVSQSTFSANDGRSIGNNGAEARLTVSDSTFSGNSGGGIYNGGMGFGGTAIVTNSTFVGNTTAGAGNSADNGGGIYNAWASVLAVSDSTFSSNSAGQHGGGIYSDGDATVGNSTFAGNSAQFGGGITGGDGAVAVSDSTFSGNNAHYGGGIYGFDSPIRVSNSTFIGNHANSGGGIDASSGLILSNSTFFDNIATGSGGAITGGNGAVAVSDSTFSGNNAHYGGGIYASWGSTVHTSTFSGNSADYGGGIYTSGWDSYDIEVSNSTFSGNSAVHDGGGIYHRLGAVRVINSSLSGNQAASGGGIYSHPDGTAVLKNTIVANSLIGNNCTGTITDGGGNLSYPDTTCPGINADPVLGPLQDNGGPTWTMALGEGSAAIDAADDAICAAPPVNNLDQRGFPRPWGAHCDIGAVEQVQEPSAVSVSALRAQSLPGTITPAMVAGLLLAVLVAVGVRRRQRHMI
jgi:predicted outer membrane repeat protein